MNAHTDFALRVLIFLRARPDEAVSVREIAMSYGISVHHLAKVAKQLVKLGWVESRRGRNGGLLLAAGTLDLSLGDVVRALEPVALAECHAASCDCPIVPACELKLILDEATEAFYATLDRYTVADLARHPRRLMRLMRPLEV